LIADYQTTVLPNGITIATAAIPHIDSVSAEVWARVAARNEHR